MQDPDKILINYRFTKFYIDNKSPNNLKKAKYSLTK